MKQEELISRLEEIRKKIKNKEYPMLSIDSLIRQIQIDKEEPVTIWHDANEKPKPNGELTKEFYQMKILVVHTDTVLIHTIYDYRNLVNVVRWAYVDDLLNLTNQVTKMSEQEKAGSDELEKEIEKYMNHNYYIDEDSVVCDRNNTHYDFCENNFKEVARHFANWQKQQDNKLPHVHQRDTIDEYAYQCAYDISNDWARDYPEWKDVMNACRLGAEWKCNQMMKESLDGIVQTDNLVSLIEFNRIEFAKLLTKYNNGDRVKLIIIKED